MRFVVGAKTTLRTPDKRLPAIPSVLLSSFPGDDAPSDISQPRIQPGPRALSSSPVPASLPRSLPPSLGSRFSAASNQDSGRRFFIHCDFSFEERRLLVNCCGPLFLPLLFLDAAHRLPCCRWLCCNGLRLRHRHCCRAVRHRARACGLNFSREMFRKSAARGLSASPYSRRCRRQCGMLGPSRLQLFQLQLQLLDSGGTYSPKSAPTSSTCSFSARPWR